MLAWNRELIALRRRLPPLRASGVGVTRVRFDEHERWIEVGRGDVTVFCNLADETRTLPPTSVLIVRSDPTRGG